MEAGRDYSQVYREFLDLWSGFLTMNPVLLTGKVTLA